MKWILLLILAACSTPNPLLDALNRPTILRSINLESTAVAEPIYEVTVHQSGSTLPPTTVVVLPSGESAELHINFDAGSFERNAWIIASPTLLATPINWGSQDDPVWQLIPFDVILPFPGLRITDYNDKRWHRQPTSALIELHDSIRLPAPIYIQLIVEAPEANELGFLAGDAYGLIPGR